MTNDRNNPIGIFDSGVGGLTVARQVIREMPYEKIVYFGDTARAPYGVRTKDEITAFSMQIMRFLTERRMKMVIIACNTICVTSYYELQASFRVPIFEIVSPAAADCVAGLSADSPGVGVIATDATVKSGGYRIELLKLHPKLNIIQKPCPELIVLAEKGLADSEEGDLACDNYLDELKAAGVGSLILGCTHFPLFAKHIAAFMGDGVRLIDPAVASAAKVKAALAEARLYTTNTAPPENEFYISGDENTFENVARNLLGQDIKAVRVNIEGY